MTGVKPFEHFIITRFNLKSNDLRWNIDKNRAATLDNEWMKHRVNIFLKYCLPSVWSQSNKNFTWLIYFDSFTSEKHLKIINNALENFPSTYKLIFSESYEDFQNQYTSDVVKLTNTSTEFIITSRLDNDDVVHLDFVDVIQKKFDNQIFMPVNFVKLYMFDSIHKDRLYLDYAPSGHFVSLIEKIKCGKIKGCYSRGDRYWNQGNKIIQIKDKVYCLELIHEKNLLNDYRGFPILFKTNLSAFQLPVAIKTKLFKYSSVLKLWKMSWKKFIRFELLSK